MTDSEMRIWNKAIEAAANAVISAPVFPHKDDGVAMDAERILVLDVAQKQVRSLAHSQERGREPVA